MKKLGVLLRIAESLDRSRTGAIAGINCDVLGDSVIMKTETTGDAALEISSAMSANGEFKRSFRKNLKFCNPSRGFRARLIRRALLLSIS